MYLHCIYVFKYVIRNLISVFVDVIVDSDNLDTEIIELKVKRMNVCVPQHSILGLSFAFSIIF